MRLLFVNGTAFGGSLLSTHGLARALLRQGHEPALLHWRHDRRFTVRIHKRLENLRARAEATALHGTVDRVTRLPGRLPSTVAPAQGYPVWSSAVPANALAVVTRRFRPAAVVAASLLRPQWRQILADLRRARIPAVLYLREETALGHLDRARAIPDLLLANSAALADAAARRGHRAVMIPSVVELADALVDSTREVALVVNPLPSYGGERALEIAEGCPEIPFVLQESWRAGAAAESRLSAGRAPGNVHFRPFVARAREIYRDARVLIVPFPPSQAGNRPRAVLEAQANGIPVLASALPGLAEAVGPGGILIAPDAPARSWVEALHALWSDGGLYARLSAAAREHARRPEVHPDRIAALFHQTLAPLIRQA